jgi:hypothetical protein
LLVRFLVGNDRIANDHCQRFWPGFIIHSKQLLVTRDYIFIF